MEFYDDKISRLNVDLFIVDGLPARKLAKKLTKLSHCVLYGFALGHRYEIDYSDYKGVMKLFVGPCQYRKADPIPGDLEALECSVPL